MMEGNPALHGGHVTDPRRYHNEYQMSDPYGPGMLASGTGACEYEFPTKVAVKCLTDHIFNTDADCLRELAATNVSAGQWKYLPCQGDSPFVEGVNEAPMRPMPMCPTDVPIAVIPIRKSASTTLLAWAASFNEGLHMKKVIDLWAKSSHCRIVLMELKDQSQIETQWFVPLLPLLEPFIGHIHRGQSKKSVWHVIQAAVETMEKIWLPPMFCPMCCMSAHHPARMYLTIVRNPFARLVSCFLMHCSQQLCTRFPEFVNALYSMWRANPLLVVEPGMLLNTTLPIRILLNTAGVMELTRHWLLHLQEGLSTLLGAVGMLGHGGPANRPPVRVHALHLEAISVEWPAVQAELCRSYRYCESLPSLGQLVKNTAATVTFTRPDALTVYWTKPTIAKTLKMYHRDFQTFRYGPDWRDKQPLQVGMVKVALPGPHNSSYEALLSRRRRLVS